MSPKKKTGSPPPKATRRPVVTMGTSLPAVALIAASVLPSALSRAPGEAVLREPPVAVPTKPKVKKGAPPKQFTIPMKNLVDWAKTVVVTIDQMSIEGHSKVHSLDSDCEIHFGGHSPNFQGDPDGLVLEPMNACVQPFPGQTEQDNADWINFSNQITGTTVSVSGVPRIWPEHLSGGNEPSNPNHAVEIHPLIGVNAAGQTFDFSANVFAGDYEGGVGENTALKIAQNTAVAVSRIGASAEVSFQAGTIGNFTVLELVIERDSITSDGAGSFRMNGEVVIDDETSAPVRIVTVRGSPINAEIEKIKGKKRKHVSMTALVLFSLSPEALLEAANESNGTPVAVETPLQLILYGPPNG